MMPSMIQCLGSKYRDMEEALQDSKKEVIEMKSKVAQIEKVGLKSRVWKLDAYTQYCMGIGSF